MAEIINKELKILKPIQHVAFNILYAMASGNNKIRSYVRAATIKPPSSI